MISPLAYIDPSAKIGRNVEIRPFAYIEGDVVIGDDCVACGTCIDECPAGAISEGEKYSIDPDTCVSCGTCADVCPSGAITEG